MTDGSFRAASCVVYTEAGDPADRGAWGEMRAAPFNICIVGGGFTGAAAAIAFCTRLQRPFGLTLIEPSASLGQGVAYGGHHPLHLLNVRTRDLSIRADMPGDFLNWAFRQLDQGDNHAGLHEGLGHTFLPRQLFGEYVRQRLFEAAERRPDVDFKVVAGAALACAEGRGRYRVETDAGEPVTADVVVLATAYGLQRPLKTGALAPFETLPPERIARAESLVIIGSGLTMVDVQFGARRGGFQGTATVISRRGQLPRPHAAKGALPQQVALPRSKNISLLAASIRIACEMAERNGTAWQAIINGLRPSLQDIWQALPATEQARFLRHLRPFWDAHQHRLPMEVHARLQSEFNEGRAKLIRGYVDKVERDGEGYKLNVVRRGADQPEIMAADLAFDCSGYVPDIEQPLIKSLLCQGLARPDPHHRGIAVGRNGNIIAKGDTPAPGLFAIGPLCQGSLWEITAVPEIVAQADRAAQSLASLPDALARCERIGSPETACS
jgi:uncharacterized NAD(P)/FAD-binding protein YdhS